MLKRKANHGTARHCCHSTAMPTTKVDETKCDEYKCRGDSTVSCAGDCITSCDPDEYYALAFEIFYGKSINWVE